MKLRGKLLMKTIDEFGTRIWLTQKEKTMTDESDYRLEMENKLNDLNRKIEACRIKVSALEEEKTRQFYEHLKELDAHLEEMKTKLQELERVESAAQAEVKEYLNSTFQKAWDNLEIKLAPYVEKQ
jgi:chromosome segregation ATPase